MDVVLLPGEVPLDLVNDVAAGLDLRGAALLDEQIVEEILDVSRARQGTGAVDMLQLDASVAATCNDWAMQTRSGSRLQLVLAGECQETRDHS